MTIRTLLGTARVLIAEILRVSRREAIVGAVLLLVLTFMEGVGLLLLTPLLELVGVVEENPMPRAAGWLETAFSLIGQTPTLGSVLVLFVLIAGGRALLRLWQLRLNVAVREHLTSAYRIRIYRAMAGAEWRFLATRRPAEFVHALTGEVNRLGAAATRLTDILVATMAASVYVALAIRMSPALSALVLFGAVFLAWLMRGSLSHARTTGANVSEARSRLHTAIAEHVASLRSARTYGAVDRHADVFADLSQTTQAASLALAAGETDLQQGLELGSTIVLALIVFVAVESVGVPPALLLLMLYIFARLMPRLMSIYRQVQGLASLLPSFDAVTRLERECLDAAEPVSGQQRPLPPLTESIRFENVSFHYLHRRDAAAVSGATFRFGAGLTTAVVGPSGCGKSTVADLLLGLLTPTAGRVLIDGEPLSADRLSAWRAQVSYVSQDTFLFHDTVRANLLWARPDATDQEVWDALRMAAADGFVADLPHRLETVVGERGVMLSGGERQRLAIARALLRNPRVLVLDEATSALDPENESRIQQAIDSLQHRMTIIIITHRLATISHADLIYVMDGGRVVQSGQWDTLGADRQGRFFALARAGAAQAAPVAPA